MRVNLSAPYWVMIRDAEASILKGALDQAGGKIKYAAGLLGIEASSFRVRCRVVGVEIKQKDTVKASKYANRLPQRVPTSTITGAEEKEEE